MSAALKRRWQYAALALYRDPRTDACVACDILRPRHFTVHRQPCACGFVPNGTTVDMLAQAMIDHSLYHEAQRRLTPTA